MGACYADSGTSGIILFGPCSQLLGVGVCRRTVTFIAQAQAFLCMIGTFFLCSFVFFYELLLLIRFLSFFLL